jgi:hypothetical protein
MRLRTDIARYAPELVERYNGGVREAEEDAPELVAEEDGVAVEE